MSKEISVTLTNDMEVFLTKKSKIPIKNIIENLISEQIDNKIYFEEGFYFDIPKNKLFRPDGKAIEFTKLQNGLFHLLLERQDEIIDFGTIHKIVWKNKTMSIFTMRNVVKRIRDLTYYGFIVNHSNKGYELGTIK
jgi:DNA-binding winged helix-turn-helix (wHTH) protein